MLIKRIGWLIAFLGLFAQITGRFHGRARDFGLLNQEIMSEETRLIYALGGSAVLIIGLAIVTFCKKRSLFWALTGFFSFIGFGIVAFLKDKSQESYLEKELNVGE